ncbi:MAG: hypothetical protein GWO26_26645, partial [Phycisphaerae bacterium]|nr:hypothetical protein [Phycisphaerae bacterium]
MKRANVKSVAKIPFVSKEKAQQLVTDAKRSVASAADTATEQLIVATAQQIIHLDQTIDAQTQRMINACKLP